MVTMVTVNLTTDEAKALADLIWEVLGRLEQNELVLGQVDWDDLRTAHNKLTTAIDN